MKDVIPAMDVPVIQGARLDLVSLSPACLEAILDGRHAEASAMAGARLPRSWPGDHERFFRLRAEQMEQDAQVQPWLIRAMAVRGAGRQAVGHVGFHGPPGVNGLNEPGAVEIGYTVEPEFRRRGYALEAARALMAWAAGEPCVKKCLASISPANEPSLAMARKLGFVQVGSQWDEEDGEEIVFEIRLPLPGDEAADAS